MTLKQLETFVVWCGCAGRAVVRQVLRSGSTCNGLDVSSDGVLPVSAHQDGYALSEASTVYLLRVQCVESVIRTTKQRDKAAFIVLTPA
jgi:hypothetical protein